MDPVGAALTATKRHTETARGSLARIAPGAPAEEVASRLAVAAADLEQLRRALNSTLDYQVLCPVALPSVPAHVAEFMRTRPEPAQEDAEAAALRVVLAHDRPGNTRDAPADLQKNVSRRLVGDRDADRVVEV